MRQEGDGSTRVFPKNLGVSGDCPLRQEFATIVLDLGPNLAGQDGPPLPSLPSVPSVPSLPSLPSPPSRDSAARRQQRSVFHSNSFLNSPRDCTWGPWSMQPTSYYGTLLARAWFQRVPNDPQEVCSAKTLVAWPPSCNGFCLAECPGQTGCQEPNGGGERQTCPSRSKHDHDRAAGEWQWQRKGREEAGGSTRKRHHSGIRRPNCAPPSAASQHVVCRRGLLCPLCRNFLSTGFDGGGGFAALIFPLPCLSFPPAISSIKRRTRAPACPPPPPSLVNLTNFSSRIFFSFPSSFSTTSSLGRHHPPLLVHHHPLCSVEFLYHVPFASRLGDLFLAVDALFAVAPRLQLLPRAQCLTSRSLPSTPTVRIHRHRRM